MTRVSVAGHSTFRARTVQFWWYGDATRLLSLQEVRVVRAIAADGDAAVSRSPAILPWQADEPSAATVLAPFTLRGQPCGRTSRGSGSGASGGPKGSGRGAALGGRLEMPRMRRVNDPRWVSGATV